MPYPYPVPPPEPHVPAPIPTKKGFQVSITVQLRFPSRRRSKRQKRTKTKKNSWSLTWSEMVTVGYTASQPLKYTLLQVGSVKKTSTKDGAHTREGTNETAGTPKRQRGSSIGTLKANSRVVVYEQVSLRSADRFISSAALACVPSR